MQKRSLTRQHPRCLLPFMFLVASLMLFTLFTIGADLFRVFLDYSHEENSLITLFTICRPQHQMNVTFENVLRNWKSLSMRHINVVLYDDNRLPVLLQEKAYAYSWQIHTTPEVGTIGKVSFGDLFLDSASKFISIYYGYADCGVLFNDDFVETLKLMQSYLEGGKSVLLVGKHSAIESRDEPLTTPEEITRISWSEGVFQQTNCSPYLIIGNIQHFPWEAISPIEIGPSGCSDEFIAKAMLQEVTIVDATETVLALKQVWKPRSPAGSVMEHSTYTNTGGSALDLIGNLPYKTIRSSRGPLHLTPRVNIPLITLFTTFRPVVSKFPIHVNVIRNWALFMPYVIPVLFNTSTDPELIKIALKHNWKVLPIPRVNPDGLPYFKDMFLAAKRFTDSIFYGYCNGDILFTSGLHSTLNRLQAVRALFNQTLVIGRRSNFNFIDSKAIPYLDNAESMYYKKSSLFSADAEDYFFIDGANFPWSSLKDIVIGRPAYDNYVVAEAIRLNVTVIDATQTIHALHQTGKDGNMAGHQGAGVSWNKDIVGKYDYKRGHTTRAQYKTVLQDQQIVLLSKYKKILAL